MGISYGMNEKSIESSTGIDRTDKIFDEISNPMETLGLPTPLILGSGSFTRKLILKEMGIPFQLVVRPIDEDNLGDRSGDPSELVLTLARAKADHLISCLLDNNDDNDDIIIDLPNRKEGYLILTADQVVTHNNQILEKPQSISQAKEFVAGYSSSPPRTVGSCVITHIPSRVQVSGVDTATIYFRERGGESIENDVEGVVSASQSQSQKSIDSVSLVDLVDVLIEEGAPIFCCAGGLMVEHPLVKQFVARIEGTEDSVMGLSKRLVEELLREMKRKLDGLEEVGRVHG